MKYVRTYESFKTQKSEPVNEELLGDILKAAKGALKNFLAGVMAPFKTLKDDFKKGLKFEEVKTKFTAAIDNMLKNATANINKAKDEGEMNQMVDAFTKELEEKMAEFDKEIKTVKESKIYEGKVQDALIGGRVLFGMLKDEYARVKVEFDKKVAAAKDLNGKKQARIAELKAVVDGFKKKINDEKLVKAATDKYKTDNKIETTGGGEKIILDWGDVEVELLQVGNKDNEAYRVTKSGSKKLVFQEGKNLVVSISGEYKKGDVVKMTNLSLNGQPFQIDGKREYSTGKIERIVVNDKEVDSYKFISPESGTSSPEETVKGELTKIKGDAEKMKKVGEVLPKIIAKIDDADAMKKVTDALA